MKVRFILPVTIRKCFSLLHTIEYLNFGLVRMFVTPYRISWIIFTPFLVVSYTNCWYSDGYKLCSSCSRFVFILLKRDFLTSLSDDNQADIEAFNSTFRYLDDLLDIDNNSLLRRNGQPNLST